MNTWLLRVAGALLVTMVLAVPVKAQEQCAPKDQMLAFLEDQYGEVPVWSGVSVGGTPVALILAQNPETGSWTVLGHRRINRTFSALGAWVSAASCC